MPSAQLLPERLLVAAAVVLTAVLFTREALDPVNVIKLTALALVAVAVVATSLVRVARERVLRVPVSAAGVSAALLVAAFGASALAAPVWSTALLGAYGRNSGLLAYLAALTLFFLGLRAFTCPHGRVLVGGVVLAGLFTALYGLLQKAGIDAIPWNNPFNPIIAALGNPNFASGYLGIAASAALGGALYTGWATVWRVAAGVTAALSLLAAALSSSVQGPIAAAAGLFVVALGFALNLTSSRRRPLLIVLSSGLLAGLALLVLGAGAKAGPAAAIFSDAGSRARTFYWSAALDMLHDNPLLGVGLDHYGAFWRTSRSPESVAAISGSHYSDAAHSVPLQMLAQGGLVLGLAYAAFVIVTLLALIKGLLRLDGADRMLMASLGGGWAAYQVQSAVSIDQVPLLVLHFTLASAVIGTAGAAGLREVKLPGALKPVATSRGDQRTKKRLAALTPRTRPVTSGDLVAISLVSAVALAAAWFSLVPLRANVAAQNGDDLKRLGDGTAAFLEYDQATDLVPGQPVYWIKKGQLFQSATPPQTAQALDAFIQAAERDPYEVNAILAAARLAESEGQLDRSRSLFQQAVQVDPDGPETLLAASTFELRHNGAQAARALLERATERLPGQAALWAALGDARLVLGEQDGARQGYERALTLDPMQPTALAGLDKLEDS